MTTEQLTIADAPSAWETAEVARQGQSVYAEPGRLSWPQRDHASRQANDLLIAVAKSEGRQELADVLGIGTGPEWRTEAIALRLDALLERTRRILEELHRPTEPS